MTGTATEDTAKAVATLEADAMHRAGQITLTQAGAGSRPRRPRGAAGLPGRAPAVPPGWQLVPVEPTEAMLAAFLGYKPKDDSWLEGYRAMLAAVIVGSRTS